MVFHVRVGDDLVPDFFRHVDILIQQGEMDQGIQRPAVLRVQPGQAVGELVHEKLPEHFIRIVFRHVGKPGEENGSFAGISR